MLELKFNVFHFNNITLILLIVPCWNWNSTATRPCNKLHYEPGNTSWNKNIQGGVFAVVEEVWYSIWWPLCIWILRLIRNRWISHTYGAWVFAGVGVSTIISHLRRLWFVGVHTFYHNCAPDGAGPGHQPGIMSAGKKSNKPKGLSARYYGRMKLTKHHKVPSGRYYGRKQ